MFQVLADVHDHNLSLGAVQKQMRRSRTPCV
jgi:hypothetical protein